MQIPSRFTVAVQTLLCIGYFQDKEKVTSDFIANSVNVNPVVIRQVIQKLKAASLIHVERGAGGASLAKDPSSITLLDVYRAVGSVQGSLFGFHEDPNPNCPVGRAIEPVLGERLTVAQNAMEKELASTSLKDLLEQI